MLSGSPPCSPHAVFATDTELKSGAGFADEPADAGLVDGLEG
jgi:hypothetical protein